MDGVNKLNNGTSRRPPQHVQSTRNGRNVQNVRNGPNTNRRSPNAATAKNKGRIQANDARFYSLMKTSLPMTDSHYMESKQKIRVLSDAGKYRTANTFALNVLIEYRMDVLSWMYRIKKDSVKLCEQAEKVPSYLLITGVYCVFNEAKDKLDNYHKRIMKDISSFNEKLTVNKKRTPRSTHTRSLLQNFEKKLSQYEDIVKRTKEIFRSGLSFL